MSIDCSLLLPQVFEGAANMSVYGGKVVKFMS